MRRTLYIDIDSTIWPAEDEYREAEMAIYGTDKLRFNYYTPEEMQEMYGENYKELLFKALSPDKVMERELYPGCAEILCNLYRGMNGGYDLYFLSHNHFAKEMDGPLREWLDREMHPGVEYQLKVMHERYNKYAFMRKDPTAYALIDDRPRNVLDAQREGYHVLSKKQTWNEHLDSVPMFDDWYEVPNYLPNHTEYLLKGVV